MSKREVNQLAEILTDPENVNRSAEEVAGLILERMYPLALSKARAEIRDEIRREIIDNDAAERRLAVIGQITYGPQEPTHTVVLGPFRSTRPLPDEERFGEVVKLPNTQAREAGQGLAWDTKSGTGSGRFMLVPAFIKPRDAWDFYRGTGPVEVIRQALEERPQHLGPVCLCGMQGAAACRFCGGTYEQRCPLHEPEADVHRCRKAA